MERNKIRRAAIEVIIALALFAYSCSTFLLVNVNHGNLLMATAIASCLAAAYKIFTASNRTNPQKNKIKNQLNKQLLDENDAVCVEVSTSISDCCLHIGQYCDFNEDEP